MSKAKSAHTSGPADSHPPNAQEAARVGDEVRGPVGGIPCVGLPVQFCNGREVIPGVLQRRSVVNPELFDVKISLSGAGVWVTRSGVRFSAEPEAGCWSYLPGF